MDDVNPGPWNANTQQRDAPKQEPGMEHDHHRVQTPLKRNLSLLLYRRDPTGIIRGRLKEIQNHISLLNSR